jgi:hypothetical protein
MSSITVSSIGNENVYITLTMRHLGAKIELVTELTIYYPLSGRYETEELARQIADDEDEAIEIATDLEWAAVDKLKIMDVTDTWKEPAGYPEALERIFETSVSYPVAAE